MPAGQRKRRRTPDPSASEGSVCPSALPHNPGGFRQKRASISAVRLAGSMTETGHARISFRSSEMSDDPVSPLSKRKMR